MENESEANSPLSEVATPPRSTTNNIHIKVLQRDKLVRRLTSVSENLEQFSRLSPYQLETKLSLLDHHFQLFDKLQAELESLDESQIEQDHRSAFEDTFCEVKSAIVQRIAESRRVDALNSTTLPAVHSTPATRHSLPKLQLTKFDGNHTEWLDFYNMFSTLVHNNSALDDIEKFQYLRSCLTNNAFRLIQSLEVTNDNYNRAIDLLVRRYDNKRYIFQSHLQAIFDSKGPKTSSASSLREFIDSVNSNLRALQSLATKPQIADGILLYFIVTKLDPEMQVKWEEYVASKWDNPSSSSFQLPSWDDLATFIERRCQTVNIIEVSRKAVAKSTPAARSLPPGKSGKSFVTSAISKCLLCNEASSHSAFKCAKFNAMDPVQRYDLAKKNRLCLNCLGASHTSIKCPSTKRCQTCGVSHHTLLLRHPETTIQRRSDAGLPAEPPSASTTLQVSLNQSQVLLGTALIQISTSRGTVMQARALLDSASQLNFITENVAQHLRVKRTPVNLEVAGIGQNATNVRHTAAVVIRSLTNAYTASLNTIIISTITSNQPQQFIDTSAWPIPTNIRLADTGFHTPGPIDVLIGASLFFDLMLLGQIKINELALQKTQLGWIVSGECKGASPSRAPTPYKSFVATSDEPTIDRTLERFWIMEEPPSQSLPLMSHEERACEQFFDKTVRRCPVTSKFIVRLPFKGDPSLIGQSLNIASRRLSSLQARLRSNPELQQQYSAFINEYIDLQHMQLCSADDTLTHAVNYIPHHCVTKDDSSTTKLRVVFDASCRTSNGTSLNDLLMVGPSLQDDLVTILMRFRRHAYVIMADISKMYRQVWVDERDTKYQCILWNDKPRESPSTYHLKTITYGTSCAPYLAIKCLRTLAEQHKTDLPIGSAVTLQDFYVDNLMSGGSTISEVLQLRDQVITLLNHGGFPLRKFASNSPKLLEDIRPEDQEEIVQLNGVDYVKALGIKWAPQEDCFLFYYSSPSSVKHPTKRSILSHIATFFDPLGLLNPVIVTCKIMMQELWKLKLHWDESVPQHIATGWENFKAEMTQLTHLKIPRFVPITTLTQIHIFADASTKAYGTCAYAVTTNHLGTTSCLLCAKSRVAPTREVSLPRLELCAAMLASELAQAVITIYHIEPRNIYYWSDSMITLAWIAGEPSRWNVFVANRVTKIQQNTAGGTWGHVPSTSNPADLVSRGTIASKLVNNSLWFQGPEFLTSGYDQWPQQQPLVNDEVPEQRNSTSVLMHVTTGDIISNHKYINNVEKLCRIFAYVRRFILHGRNHTLPYSTHDITASEINESLITVCRCIQQKHYASEIAELASGKPLNRKSSLVGLTPFVHQGTLRVGGRLTNSSLPFASKHPILLPPSHPFLDSLILHFHRKHLHAGAQTLHNILRGRFWIINARSTIKKLLRRCIICIRCRPMLAQQLLGNLPAPRVEMSHPFTTCGVDYCGPFVYTQRIQRRPPIKVYLAIFICFSTKAVHIELVPDLTTAAFIAALKRFIARRGKCHTIFSDNATNFVGADRELQTVLKNFTTQQHANEVISACTDEGIEWKFIPPRSPHFGGLWESAVKQAKYFLRRTIGQHILSWDELHTLCCQVEALINSRPLTELSSDPNDLQPLTPGHFLIGRALTAVSEPALPTTDSLRRYQLVQGLQQQFWRRWHMEYLHELQQRQKWKSPTPNLQPGDVVILKEENTPPFKWPLGRIQKTIPGADGHIRVVVVKTANGTFERAISKVCKLPTNITTTIVADTSPQSSQTPQDSSS